MHKPRGDGEAEEWGGERGKVREGFQEEVRPGLGLGDEMESTQMGQEWKFCTGARGATRGPV